LYKKIISIDPGLHGAISILDLEKNILSIYKMPIHPEQLKEKTKSGKQKIRNKYTVSEVANIFKPHIFNSIVLIEKVATRPTDSPIAAFTFGYGVGMLHGILETLGIPYEQILPQVWQHHFRLLGEDKNASRQKASDILPLCTDYWKLKKDDGLAESLLIGVYYIQKNGIDINLEKILPDDTLLVKNKRIKKI